MNERIKKVRTTLGMSRQAFGEKLGCSGDVINNAERGRASITDMFVNLLCKEFNVNEEWLRTGNGDMFNEMSAEDEIAAYMGKMYNLPEDDPRKQIIMAMAKIPEEYWGTIREIMDIVTGKK